MKCYFVTFNVLEIFPSGILMPINTNVLVLPHHLDKDKVNHHMPVTINIILTCLRYVFILRSLSSLSMYWFVQDACSDLSNSYHSP